MHLVSKDATSGLCSTVRREAKRFIASETGATAIEYSLLAALMALACITAFSAVGGSQGGAWGNTANKVGNAMK